jgi:MoaA/NifB/PqqE/SkfB family radical SAM enzyme
MCDIWKTDTTRELSLADLERHAADIERLRVEWVVLSGGEPLMHSDLPALCRFFQQRNIRVTVVSTGLLLERHTEKLVSAADDVIVSLDGPPELHDGIRRMPGAFARLTAGVRALHRARPDFPVAARCTVQRMNCRHLRQTTCAAQTLGLRSISFLAADTTSPAFNHPDGWTEPQQHAVRLSREDVEALAAEIEALISEWHGAAFVLESPEKLRQIVRRLSVPLGLAEAVAPPCNAPWVSAVIETDGTVRPCFFHPPIGRVGARSLMEVLNGPEAVAFRQSLDVTTNPVCRQCVCSLKWLRS